MPVGYPTNAFFYKGEWYNTDGEGMPATAITDPLTGGVGITIGEKDLYTSIGDADKNAAAMQRAANGGRLHVLSGVGQMSDTVLIGSNTSISMAPGVHLASTGVAVHTLFRTGNAEFAQCNSIDNVWIICADEASYSAGASGEMEFVPGPARLRWRAPGDTYGAYVDVSGASITQGWFSLPSGTAGKSVHVMIGGGAFPVATTTRAVRVEPVTGAKPIAWSRAGGVVTVTEGSHARKIGDTALVFFGATAWHGYVASADSTGWTFVQAGATESGTATAYGVQNITMSARGATLDGGKSTLAAAADGHNNMVLFFAVGSRMQIEPPNIVNNQKYGTSIHCSADFSVRGARSLPGNNDCVHVCGPARKFSITDTIAKGGDNIVGIGCTDYITYAFSFPANGVVDIEDYDVDGVEARDTKYEPVRLYVANSGWLRRGKIRNISGTVDPATSAAVGVITDNNGLTVDAGATNIDGLEISNVNVSRADGSELRQVTFSGTGTRRNIRLSGVAWRNNGVSVLGSVFVSSVLDDLTVINSGQNVSKVCGAYVNLSSSGQVGTLRVQGNFENIDSAASGANVLCSVLYLESTNSKVSRFILSDSVLVDTSTSGNGLRAVVNNGKKMTAILNNVIVTSTDPATRKADRVFQFGSTAEAGSDLFLTCVVADTNFGVVIDGGVPQSLTMSGLRHTGNKMIHGAAATPGTVKVRGSGVSTAEMLSSTLTNITVDISDGLPCDVSRAARVSGNYVSNTNAAAGTLGSAGIVVCSGTSTGSWKLAVDPTKTY